MSVCQSPALTVNQANLCLDIKDCNITPTIIDFPTNALEDIHDKHLLTKYPRGCAQDVQNKDVPRTGVSQSPVLTLNHAYFCLDIEDCNIKPAIIGFLNITREDIHDIHLSAQRSRSHTQHVHTEDVLHTGISQSPVLTLNHAYFCLDIKGCNINPTIIGFLNIAREDIRDIHLFAKRSRSHTQHVQTEAFATNTTSYLNARKRKVAYPLSIPSAELPSSSGNMIRRFTVGVNNRSLRSKSSHAQGSLCPEEGHHPCFLYLYVYDTHDEVSNRMRHFGGIDENALNPEIVQARVLPRSDVEASKRYRQRKKVTMNAYYKYQLHPLVKEFGLIFKSGRLFQQYVVAVYYAIEMNRLDYIQKNQNDLRSDYLSGLYDVVSREDREGITASSKIMLPNTFTGEPRYMYNHYLDALAICRSLGNPQFFITFTCNVKWPEIKRYMAQYPELTPNDRAYIVCRVFEQKVIEFIKFLKEVKTFGYVCAVLYTIEFQKRGLPHCHTLLWVDSKSELQDAQYMTVWTLRICTEIPDPVEDPRDYKLMTELMMHGPCGSTNSSASCTKGDLFYFRMLLCHQKGCKSLADVQTINGVIHPNNRAACEALDPIKLWIKHWEAMSDDIPTKISKAKRIPNYHVNTAELKGYILYELEAVVNGFGKSVIDFGLPLPPKHLLKDLENKLLMEEKNYKRDLLKQEVAELVPKLNHDPKKIYDLIMGASLANQQELLFVYGHGGTRKTFLWKIVISLLRAEGKIVLAVTLSGIASLLLPAGPMAHSRIKLPLELTDESLCHAKKRVS
ncbi:DNA helicase [Tanacetum coccineum]